MTAIACVPITSIKFTETGDDGLWIATYNGLVYVKDTDQTGTDYIIR